MLIHTKSRRTLFTNPLTFSTRMTDELKHKKDDYQTIGCCGKKRKKPLLPLMKAENSLCKLKIFFEWVIPTFIEGRGFFKANYNPDKSSGNADQHFYRTTF